MAGELCPQRMLNTNRDGWHVSSAEFNIGIQSCPNWFVLYAESEKEHIQGCQTLSSRLTDAE